MHSASQTRPGARIGWRPEIRQREAGLTLGLQSGHRLMLTTRLALDPGGMIVPLEARTWHAVPPTADEPELLRATQMLTSEQAVLQSARAANVAEATGRTLLFVSITSAAIFGLGLIAQMARLGPLFIAFSLLLLPGLCLLGVETL